MMPLLIRLLVFAIALSACLAPVVLALRRTGSRPRIGEPRCARCGYIVRGLDSRICPECGSKLYPDGIVYPRPRRRLAARPRAKHLAWTALLVWLGCFFAGAGKVVPDLLLGPGIAIEKTETDYLWLEEPRVGCQAIRAAVVLRDIDPKLTPRDFIVGAWNDTVPRSPEEG